MKKNVPIVYIYKTEIPETDWEKQFWILDFRLGGVSREKAGQKGEY